MLKADLDLDVVWQSIRELPFFGKLDLTGTRAATRSSNRKAFAEFNKAFPGLLSSPGEFCYFMQHASRETLDRLFCHKCGKRTNFQSASYGGWTEFCSIQCAGQTCYDRGKKTVEEMYGKGVPMSMAGDADIKRRNTNLERYGDECSARNPAVKAKAKETFRRHFGADHFMQTEQGMKVFKQSMREKHGVDFPYQNPDILNKMVSTSMEKYGVPNPSQCDEIRARMSASRTEEVKEAQRNTMLERYGSEYAMQVPSIKRMAQKSILKNRKGRCGTSKEELHLLKELRKIFPDIVHQYCDPRYADPNTGVPFACDFYLPSHDLFIEFQGHWTHGGGPFNPDRAWCNELRDDWVRRGQSSEYYKLALHVWCESDPLKRRVVEQQNLNWVEFFTSDSLLEHLHALHSVKIVRNYMAYHDV